MNGKGARALYSFLGSDGTFQVQDVREAGPIYFPLANELGLLSAITPDLHGDIKTDHHSFLTPPVSFEDLHLSRANRNFWINIHPKGKKSHLWSVSGNSVWQKSNDEDDVSLEAGFLWHAVARKNKRLGIQTRVLSFVPVKQGAFEVLFVEVENISKKPFQFTATSAIPLFGRSADNLRDHRHVTSLLHRLARVKFGVKLCPTMSFNERGHLVNSTNYFVLGADEKGRPPEGIFPTVSSFIGPGGSLDRPLSLMRNQKPLHGSVQSDGAEAMGALQFGKKTLKPGRSTCFTVLMGIDKDQSLERLPFQDFIGTKNIQARLDETKKYWLEKATKINFVTGDPQFDLWSKWVEVQPVLRKIYGCSFLPDFDYGRGGRGWRDLWQDCLALLLASPEEVRDDIVRNFGGVRIDGSNATIIGRKAISQNGTIKWMPEFIADRNNIVRTWMDHGVWPFLTTLLYINQSGDFDVLLEKVPYFRDAFLFRGERIDKEWAVKSQGGAQLKTRNGAVYEGTVLEHILVQTLVQFFNVGEHNIIRLEDADWNDGLDMAKEKGESAAFTSMYAGNLGSLADLLENISRRAGWKGIDVAEEVASLMDRVRSPLSYDNALLKRKHLHDYFSDIAGGVRGKVVTVPLSDVIFDLREKAKWIAEHLNKREWIEVGREAWFNGYYDNKGQRVEGMTEDGRVQMTLAGQVYPIMTGVADNARVRQIVAAVDKFLWDKKLGGVRLNNNFKTTQPQLGRAFSFAFGEKENGAIFSHMAVMYAFALYRRGFVRDGHKVLNGLYRMATESKRSQIYPGLPEYFNNEGRGRYAYLTGSASWYILTLLTQVFGVRGELGDLLISPKLHPDQFDKKKNASVEVFFAGARIKVIYHNPLLLSYDQFQIKDVSCHQGRVPFVRRSDKEVLINRKFFSDLSYRELFVRLDKIS